MKNQRSGLLGVVVGLAFVALPVVLAAQEVFESTPVAEVSEPVYPYVFQGDVRNLPPAPEWGPGDPIRVRVQRWRTPDDQSGLPGVPEPFTDPLLARQAAAAGRQDRGFGTPLLNITVQTFQNVFPPDTVGDVGSNHYIHIVNAGVGTPAVILDKSGTLLAGPFLLQSLAAPGSNCASGYGDPIVVYDQLADRWLMSEFAEVGDYLCVYISQTNDPVSGGWYAYQFLFPYFPDYPKYGVWPDAYYGTGNEAQGSRLGLYAFDRTAMLAGAAATYQRWTTSRYGQYGFQSLMPAGLLGATLPPAGAPGIIMRHHTPNLLDLWQVYVDWATPANSHLDGPTQVGISTFDGNLCTWGNNPCIPQENTTQKLDTLNSTLMFRLSYRNFGDHQTLVGNFTVDVGSDQAGLRWFELRDTGAGWSLFQEGTYAPDADHRWMAGIAMDRSGNIALGYSKSGSSMFPGVFYTGRLSSDPAGTMTQAETQIKAGTNYQNYDRWGDYSAMGVDPTDDCTFWYTQMFATGSNHVWGTQLATFKFDACSAAIFADSFETGDTGAWSATVP